MRYFRQLTRLATCLSLSGFGLLAQAADGIETYTSGAPFFKRAVTNTNVLTTSATTFANVPGTGTTVFVPPQTAVLISVDFSAEASCSRGTLGAGDWCEVQTLIGGVEGAPQASTFGGDTYSFTSTDNGAASANSWRGHALSRHRCVRNTGNAPLAVPVVMQWKTVQFGVDAVSFWLDDSAMVVQMSRECLVTLNPTGASRVADQPATAGQL